MATAIFWFVVERLEDWKRIRRNSRKHNIVRYMGTQMYFLNTHIKCMVGPYGNERTLAGTLPFEI